MELVILVGIVGVWLGLLQKNLSKLEKDIQEMRKRELRRDGQFREI
jgi:hypothetical protein